MTTSEEIADLETTIEEAAEQARRDPDTPWMISDDRTAIWAGRKWAAAQARLDAIDEEAAHQIEQVREWQAARRKADEETASWFGNQLEAYALRERLTAEAEGRRVRATIPLVGCSVGTRDSKPRIQILDDKKLTVFLLRAKLDDLVAITHSTKLAELQKAATVVRRAVHGETGEVIEHDGKAKKWPPPEYSEIASEIRLNGEQLPEWVGLTERKVTAKVSVTKSTQTTTEGPEE